MARNLWNGCPGGCGCRPEKAKLIYRYAEWLPSLPNGEQGMQIDFVGVWPALNLMQFIEDSRIFGRRLERYNMLMDAARHAGWNTRLWIASSDEDLRTFGEQIRFEHQAGVAKT